MGGRGGSLFPAVALSLDGTTNHGHISPLITAGLAELRGNEADTESTLQRIDDVRFNDLTHEQLFIVDRDGFVIEGYDGNKNSVSFPSDRAALWRDHVVTHRHPDSFGGTFSLPDIYNIATFGWAEMEASANEGRYNIKRTRNANSAGLVKHLQREQRAIEQRMRERGLEISKRKHLNKEEFLYINRKLQLQIVEEWYQQTLPQYGYEYTFLPRKDDNNE